jgi:hypothetical protein
MDIHKRGLEINVNNFKLLVETCKSFGENYAPRKKRLKIENLIAKSIAMQVAHKSLSVALKRIKVPINYREDLYAYLGKRLTIVLAYVRSLDESANCKEDVKLLVDKMRKMKATWKKLPDGNPDPDDVSKSHLSYVMRADHYKNLIAVLDNESLYAPDDMAINLVTMVAEHAAMEALNEKVSGMLNHVNQARLVRNFELYDLDSGGLRIGEDCKLYVKTLYGAGSEEYAQVRIIKFKKPK